MVSQNVEALNKTGQMSGPSDLDSNSIGRHSSLQSIWSIYVESYLHRAGSSGMRVNKMHAGDLHLCVKETHPVRHVIRRHQMCVTDSLHFLMEAFTKEFIDSIKWTVLQDHPIQYICPDLAARIDLVMRIPTMRAMLDLSDWFLNVFRTSTSYTQNGDPKLWWPEWFLLAFVHESGESEFLETQSLGFIEDFEGTSGFGIATVVEILEANLIEVHILCFPHLHIVRIIVNLGSFLWRIYGCEYAGVESHARDLRCQDIEADIDRNSVSRASVTTSNQNAFRSGVSENRRVIVKDGTPSKKVSFKIEEDDGEDDETFLLRYSQQARFQSQMQPTTVSLNTSADIFGLNGDTSGTVGISNTDEKVSSRSDRKREAQRLKRQRKRLEARTSKMADTVYGQNQGDPSVTGDADFISVDA